MLTRYLLPLLALVGIAFSIFTVIQGDKPVPVSKPVSIPPESPYKVFVTGAGIVEAESRNIEIGTPLSGIVQTVHVKVNAQVKAGELLFALDDRDALAELKMKKAELIRAKAGLVEAEARLADARSMRRLIESVTDKRAVSIEDVDKRRHAEMIAKAAVESARAMIQQAEASIIKANTTLERLQVKAPIDGEVIQVNIRPGEFAQAGVLNNPLVVLGRLDALHVRVDIDENDAWRFNKNGRAIAFLRGNRQFKADLTLAYVEPYVVPKKSLTGDSSERVDTRVLQVIYRFKNNQIPVYVGQQMDVYIEVPEDTQKVNNQNQDAIQTPQPEGLAQ